MSQSGVLAPRLPLGFLRRRIAEIERKRVEEYLTGLRDIFEQYTLPTDGQGSGLHN